MKLRAANERKMRFVRQPKKEPIRKRPLAQEKSAIEKLRLQNKFRTLITRITPTGLKPVHEIGTGVDFRYSNITIDQKFSFGVLGENTILARINERAAFRQQRLINKSNWMMVVHANGKVDFFQTQKMAEFIERNFDSLQKLNKVVSNNPHLECAVDLTQFYKDPITRPQVITADLELARLTQNGEPNQYTIDKMRKRLFQALEKVKSANYKELVPAPPKPKIHVGLYGIRYGVKYDKNRARMDITIPRPTKKQRGFK